LRFQFLNVGLCNAVQKLQTAIFTPKMAVLVVYKMLTFGLCVGKHKNFSLKSKFFVFIFSSLLLMQLPTKMEKQNHTLIIGAFLHINKILFAQCKLVFNWPVNCKRKLKVCLMIAITPRA